MKPVEQVIKELKAERDEIKNKNKAAGQMISNGTLDNEQNLLLSMQMSAYKTVTHVLDARIRSLEKQMPAIEEPKKVVLTKEQAEIVKWANQCPYPAKYITKHTFSSDDEKLIMSAYVKGWTVKRPQRWYVKTPGNWMGNEKQGWLYKITGVINTLSEDRRECTQDEQFTEKEISDYGLQDCEKEEVTDYDQ